MTVELDYATAVDMIDMIEENLKFGQHNLFQINSITFQGDLRARLATLNFRLELDTLRSSDKPHEVRVINLLK